MKNLVLFLLFISTDLFAADIKLNDVRVLFQKSASDEASCKKIISELNTYDEFSNTTLAGYKASATIMMAKYCSDPFKKLSYFKKGKSLLEKCIAKDSSNIETRYLRFTIQSSVPDFLRYNTAIQKDKIFLMKHLNKLHDLQLKQMIISFLRSSPNLSSTEKQNLKS